MLTVAAGCCSMFMRACLHLINDVFMVFSGVIKVSCLPPMGFSPEMMSENREHADTVLSLNQSKAKKSSWSSVFFLIELIE